MRLAPVVYLSSYVLSLLGNSIAAIALPLIILQTTGSALGAGTVAAATAVPAFVAGLLMGVVIDRTNRRTCSVVTDLVSAGAIAALPLVDVLTGLALGWFVLFGIVGSLGDVPGLTAREALLPAVVRHGGITAERLLGIRESLGAAALVVGPAAAGTLVVLFDGSTVLWITAATSLSAALVTLLLPHHVGAIVTSGGQPAAVVGSGWSQLREGWHALFRSRFLVAVTTVGLVPVVILSALQGLILPVYFTLTGSPGLLGFVLTALAAGGLLGGAVYAVAGGRGRRRTWFLVGLGGMTLGFGLIAPLASAWVVLAGAFVVGLSNGLFASLVGVLMVERVPEQMRGRVMGTQNALMTVAPPVGIMVAAVLTQYANVDVATVALVAVWLVAVVVGVFGRSLRQLGPTAQHGADDRAEAVADA